MIEIKEKEMCCGCHACKNICPKECICMEDDNEGFSYPKVNKYLCIECNLCEKVCPVINMSQNKVVNISAYACKNKDENIRKNSSSGGIFALLCEIVINKGVVIFGATFDDEFNVYHTYAETLSDCNKFMGSKYVQSKIGDTYSNVKEFLTCGRIVLFSGTPCQISGLNAYLGQKYSNLILIDIACHGVPSPLVYREYLKKIKLINKSKIKSINFRDKASGWKGYNFKVEFYNGCLSEKGYDNIYMKGFLRDIYLRPSCYRCKFKKPITSADLTLADYWGVQYKHPELDDDKGISLILVNSEKGKKMLNNINDKANIIETSLDYAINNNPCIVSSVKYNARREEFFKMIKKKDIESCIKKCIEPNLIMRLKSKFIRILHMVKS